MTLLLLMPCHSSEFSVETTFLACPSHRVGPRHEEGLPVRAPTGRHRPRHVHVMHVHSSRRSPPSRRSSCALVPRQWVDPVASQAAWPSLNRVARSTSGHSFCPGHSRLVLLPGWAAEAIFRARDLNKNYFPFIVSI
jgi:hypothetical protein